MKRLGVMAAAAFLTVISAFGAPGAGRSDTDCSQGLLIPNSTSNWYLQGQGSGNVMFSAGDTHVGFEDRWGYGFSLMAGKWVTPAFGFRFGFTYVLGRGATTIEGRYLDYTRPNLSTVGWYPEALLGYGPEMDLTVNLTDWWCGYRAGRVYTADFHLGMGAYFTMAHRKRQGHDKWVMANATPFFGKVGLQQNFRVAKRVSLFLDASYEALSFSKYTLFASVGVGVKVELGQQGFKCPRVGRRAAPVYTDEEGTSMLRRLEQADMLIVDLQERLEKAESRNVSASEAASVVPALVTVYYPIGEYTLSKREKGILRSIAEIIKEHPKSQYTLTGWADNYTGDEQVNNPLRHERVAGVREFLIGCGVDPSQLYVKVNSRNLSDLGEAAAPLDRAVTISLRSASASPQ